MPPNPTPNAFISTQLNSPLEQPSAPTPSLQPLFPANWPNSAAPPAPIDIETNLQAISADWGTVEAQLSKSKRETPSKARCFYLNMTERDVNAYMNLGNAFGVEEAAILEGETKVTKNQQTVFVMKCVGRLEFTKPKFEELEDYDEAGPTTA